MTDRHEPRPDFVSNLEWQIKTSLQREDRFSRPVSQTRLGRGKTVFLVLVSAFVGAGAVMASEQVQQSRAKEILLLRAQGQQRIAALQLEMALANFQDVEERYEVGIIHEEDLILARLPLREAEGHIQSLRLDEEEIQASGKTPDNQITAPLLDGRDFVTERLRLDLEKAMGRFSHFQNRLGWAREAMRLGQVASESDHVRQAEASVVFSETDVARIQEKMALRQRFLDGEIMALEVEAGLEINEAESQLERHRLEYDLMNGQMGEAIEAVELGIMAESSLKRFRLRLMELELEMEILERTLELLRGQEGGG